MDHSVLTDYVNAMFGGQPEAVTEPLKPAAVPPHQAMTPCFKTPKDHCERVLALWTVLSLARLVPQGRVRQRLLNEALYYLESLKADRRT